MVENPVPKNNDLSKKLDDVLKSILRDKHQTNEINLDNILGKIQGKFRDFMSPLFKLWTIIETAKNCEENQVMVSMEDLLSFVEQCYLTSAVTLYYTIRLRLLSALSPSIFQTKELVLRSIWTSKEEKFPKTTQQTFI